MMQVVPAFEAIADFGRLLKSVNEQDCSCKIVSVEHRAVLVCEKQWERMLCERNLLYCAGVRKFVREHMRLTQEEAGWMADFAGDEKDVVQLMEKLLAVPVKRPNVWYARPVAKHDASDS